MPIQDTPIRQQQPRQGVQDTPIRITREEAGSQGTQDLLAVQSSFLDNYLNGSSVVYDYEHY